MKVIFLKNLAKVGSVGEIKEIANGYALNVLIPKKIAIIATASEIIKINSEKKQKENKKDLNKKLFLENIKILQEQLKSNKLTVEQINEEGILEIYGQKHHKGKLFAAILVEDILQTILHKTKIFFNANQIILPTEPIKSHGNYEIFLQEQDQKIKLKIKVC